MIERYSLARRVLSASVAGGAMLSLAACSGDAARDTKAQSQTTRKSAEHCGPRFSFDLFPSQGHAIPDLNDRITYKVTNKGVTYTRDSFGSTSLHSTVEVKHVTPTAEIITFSYDHEPADARFDDGSHVSYTTTDIGGDSVRVSGQVCVS